jgi:hypothetical protein
LISITPKWVSSLALWSRILSWDRFLTALVVWRVAPKWFLLWVRRDSTLLAPFLILALWTVSSWMESPAGSGNYAVVAENDALVGVVTPATTDFFSFDGVSWTNADRPRIEFLLE